MEQPRTLAWRRLDNAAKIFPPNSSRTDTKVFRFSCTLTESVDEKALQQALDRTILEFPMYQSIIRRGLFWYYFESSNLVPVVKEEYKVPCGILYDGNIKTLLFEVTYYKKRINLEVYHALTDATGALQFLRTLVMYYLKVQHTSLENVYLVTDDLASLAEREDDSFDKYYHKKKVRARRSYSKSYKVKGEKYSEYRIQVIRGVMATDAVLSQSKQYDTTMTVFLCSLLIHGIAKQMTARDRKKPISVSIPVNLRKYFQSASARNFFSVMTVQYTVGEQSLDLESIIKAVDEQFKKELLAEHFQDRLNTMVSLEHSYVTRFIPLPIKRHTLKAAHRLVNRELTSVLSNVGKVDMPEEVAPYIEHFDMYVSTEKIQIGLCSYNNRLSVSFTSPFVNTEIQKNFFRELTSRGIEVKIATNIR